MAAQEMAFVNLSVSRVAYMERGRGLAALLIHGIR
jgi:hypothetical protein